MSDLISRQAVKNLITMKPYDWSNITERRALLNEIDNLPFAEPERHRGEWIDGMPYVNSHWRVCSVCHESAPESCGGYNFCPNCGAEMTRGE